MNRPNAEESNLRPLMLLGGAIVFVAAILIVDGAIGDDRKADRDVNPPDRGGGSTSLIPGAPVPGLAGGSPVPDGPAVTIIQDVREIMNRLPDRNTPIGAEPYKPRLGPRKKPN